ncbi:hypothetical protein J8273_3947 [Carpediemonas membranifera]|uniref:Uncharacterized protein n=1 Tax=Carpediemonas membranifera TaxID=201153 RepID=A0A8J6E264_9EUKA|nr:hypothetical protein J8273_3947 [Carpediemonas membranifera]|eukprot:KAG9394313.1 hypothetical protein J8273_3947 [Carpediemonas membranifera]
MVIVSYTAKDESEKKLQDLAAYAVWNLIERYDSFASLPDVTAILPQESLDRFTPECCTVVLQTSELFCRLIYILQDLMRHNFKPNIFYVLTVNTEILVYLWLKNAITAHEAIPADVLKEHVEGCLSEYVAFVETCLHLNFQVQTITNESTKAFLNQYLPGYRQTNMMKINEIPDLPPTLKSVLDSFITRFRDTLTGFKGIREFVSPEDCPTLQQIAEMFFRLSTRLRKFAGEHTNARSSIMNMMEGVKKEGGV